MHGLAGKSCTKVAPFFPGTVLGLTAKIPPSAEFPRHVPAGAAPPPRISTRNSRSLLKIDHSPHGQSSSLFLKKEAGTVMKNVWNSLIYTGMFGPLYVG
jgi:hypothetical protein